MARPKRIRPEEIDSQSKFISITKDFLNKEGGTSKDLEAALKRENVETQSKFVLTVEEYLVKARWTKAQFMAEMQVGESQFYRWARGENIPTKAIINRAAVTLASRFDVLDRELPHNPFPMSDKIDGLLNELLVASGYSASITGDPLDSSWQDILKDRSWTIGYTLVPLSWAKPPERKNGNPTGIAIECAERVGKLLGITTEWKFLTWQEMPRAIAEREVHGIAPFMLTAPGRVLDYRLSDPWTKWMKMEKETREPSIKLAGVTLFNKIKKEVSLEDLSVEHVQLVYVDNEIGEIIVALLDNTYDSFKCKTLQEAIAYLDSFKNDKGGTIPIICSDGVFCRELSSNEVYAKSISTTSEWQYVTIGELEKYRFNPAFAFHPSEEKLTAAVNSVLKLIN